MTGFALRSTVQITSKGDAIKRLEKIIRATKGPTGVRVGFPSGSDAGIVAIAIYNHEGTSRGIPPRPFITVALFKNRTRIRVALRKIAEDVLAGKSDLRSGLNYLGLIGQQIIQDQIASNMPPANAPSTIKKKGSSRTLIDKGNLRGAVTWKIEE